VSVQGESAQFVGPAEIPAGTDVCQAGAEEQANRLARRAAANTPLDDPGYVAVVVEAGAESAGAGKRAVTLLARDPAARVSLDDPFGVARLLNALREADAGEQVRTLVDRLPAEGKFGLFREKADHQMRYQFGRESDGRPAPSWDWGDLD
jgi:hypothetical protein